ncbi:DUF3169 family protein [Paenibacillus donghaensis]|uniref:DUF3169 domain-containing protein n=1 Tax=Paenibacillus donghaensis TaxID=414771 RepID=A0A2Z2KA21_9BACL|nr:DUF3169 family protein [Paenibacillus donghaensis]ASA19623.1 hypothetical protein B9T62_01575 [Paenibacillus donghaensis]
MENTNKLFKSKRTWRLIFWAFIGGVIGYISASGDLTVPKDANFSFSLIYEYDLMFAALALIVLVLLVWNVIGLSQLGAMNDEGENSDELMSPKEKLLSTIIKVSSYNTIVTLLWLVLAIAHAMAPDGPREDMQTYMLVNMISGCVTMFMAIYLQHRTLSIYNKVYPERTYNLKSNSGKEAARELFAKMDEGEQWTVYRSAYSAFRTTNVMLIAGIVLFTLYSLLFGFTPLPIIVLGIILLVQHTVYYHEAGKAYK